MSVFLDKVIWIVVQGSESSCMEYYYINDGSYYQENYESDYVENDGIMMVLFYFRGFEDDFVSFWIWFERVLFFFCEVFDIFWLKWFIFFFKVYCVLFLCKGGLFMFLEFEEQCGLNGCG